MTPEKFQNLVQFKCLRALADPGEAVGLLAAQVRTVVTSSKAPRLLRPLSLCVWIVLAQSGFICGVKYVVVCSEGYSILIPRPHDHMAWE